MRYVDFFIISLDMMLYIIYIIIHVINVYMQYTFTIHHNISVIRFYQSYMPRQPSDSGRTRPPNRHQNGGPGPDRGPTSRSHGRQKVGGSGGVSHP